jgi:hypothetical protein
MSATERNHETPAAPAAMRRNPSLATAMRIMSHTGPVTTRDHEVAASRPPLVPFLFDFLGREPFGFAFTEGQEAKFRVPSGHRFVIEHVDVCCWAKDDHLDVEFVTTSSRRYCNVASGRSLLQASTCEGNTAHACEPIWVQGSSVTTFLFSNGELQDSSTVPPDTYVQVWGYLEPTNVTAGL